MEDALQVAVQGVWYHYLEMERVLDANIYPQIRQLLNCMGHFPPGLRCSCAFTAGNLFQIMLKGKNCLVVQAWIAGRDFF
jgi:hypothetical protein